MSEFGFIYIFLIFFALCIAAVIIIKIQAKNNILSNKEDLDVFTKFYKSREELLKINMPKLSIKTYLILSFSCPFFFGIILWVLLPNKVFASMFALFSIMLPDIIIRTIIESRKKRYEEKYVRALKAFASALKAGMSVQQAVQEVTNNIFVSEDLRSAFRQIDADMRVGISIEDAFNAFAERANNDDARDVAAAISMQTAIGGSEGKVITQISTNIEDRIIARRKIRSLFSGTEYMIKFFDFAPFVMILILNIAMPDYMSPIYDSPIHLIVILGVLLFTVYGSYNIKNRLKKAKGEK